MQPIYWDSGKIILIDQTKLPHALETIACNTYQDVAEAIKKMQVRGAPAIGVAAALGMVLAAREFVNLPGEQFFCKLEEAAACLAATRPTAVNLFWALEQMQKVISHYSQDTPEKIVSELEKAAVKIACEDLHVNKLIGENGCCVVKNNARILTHCNAGALATAGYGTALGVIRSAFALGKVKRVFVDETRPLLQGARLTAWELLQDNIPVTVITDNMAGYVLHKGMVDLILVGADRIAANGDVANKIGTYSLAVLAKENNIPFYVAAPITSIDFNLENGKLISIEERDPGEVTHISGQQIMPVGVEIFNPAFDVTPARYITGIITERGIVHSPFNKNLQNLLNE